MNHKKWLLLLIIAALLAGACRVTGGTSGESLPIIAVDDPAPTDTPEPEFEFTLGPSQSVEYFSFQPVEGLALDIRAYDASMTNADQSILIRLWAGEEEGVGSLEEMLMVMVESYRSDSEEMTIGEPFSLEIDGVEALSAYGEILMGGRQLVGQMVAAEIAEGVFFGGGSYGMEAEGVSLWETQAQPMFEAVLDSIEFHEVDVQVPSPEPAADLTLGALQRDESGQFSYQPIQGLILEDFGGFVSMSAEDESLLFGFFYGEHDGANDSEAYLEYILLDFAADEVEELTRFEMMVGGYPAAGVELWLSDGEEAYTGQVVAVYIDQTHGFMAAAFGQELGLVSLWEQQAQALFEAMLDSIEFHEP